MDKRIVIKAGVNVKDALKAAKSVKKADVSTGTTKQGVSFRKVLSTIVMF